MPTRRKPGPVPRTSRHTDRLLGCIVSHRWASVASGASVELVFTNPSGSGKEAHFIGIEVIGTGKGWIDMYEDSIITTAGTSITPVKYIGSSNTSVMQIEVGGTYTAGTLINSTVVPGGSGVFAIGGGAELGVGGILGEGHNLHIKITNRSASAEDFSIRIMWWE